MASLPQILQSSSEVRDTTCDVLVVGARSSSDGVVLSPSAMQADVALGGALAESFGTRNAAQPGDVVVVSTLGRLPARHVVVAGLGETPGPSALRKAAAAAIRRVPDAQDVVSFLHEDGDEEGLAASVEGFVLAGYRFKGYKKEPSTSSLDRLTFAGAAAGTLDAATARVDATILARDLTNEPASVLTPMELARRAEQVADVGGLEIEIMGPDALAEKGFGGILAVSAGSDQQPCMIVMRYAPNDPSDHVALVGKGITYDSGGYSIKPSGSMEMMKTDMAGAAAVLAAMGALPRLGIDSAVTAYLPCAENLISGSALKPGDVVTHYGGRTTEVTNTDAEGRLVLVDGLVYAFEQGAKAVVDIATLTGGIHVALGDDVAGLFTNDDSLDAELQDAARRAGELIWRMPMIDRYVSDYDSSTADMKNSGSRWGSPIKAALFLRASVPNGTPWAHLDIAGPARADRDHHEVTKGGTGFGVRTLLRWLEARDTP